LLAAVADRANRDENLSHITSGYIYNSPAQSLVRVDQAHDGGFGSSVFNYANISSEGLVDNTLTTFHSGSLKPDVWRGYVQPGFPLFAGDILVQAGAAFSGLVRRDLTEGLVASVSVAVLMLTRRSSLIFTSQWSIMYHGAIPVTVYVDACDIVVGYDVFSPNLRTRVVTIFFNIRASRR
jgi:hypothetical protein